MADVFSKRKRSEVMARIRGRGNKDTELALAAMLRAHGIFGWRRHLLIRATVASSKLRVERKRPGSTSPRPAPQRGEGARNYQPSTKDHQLTVRPDFVFLKARTAVFVDGCFWHGCPQHGTKPKNNAAFWQKKLTANKRRDALVTRTLKQAGWRVLRIWEHSLRRANIKRLSAHAGVGSQRDEPSRIIGRIQRAIGRARLD